MHRAFRAAAVSIATATVASVAMAGPTWAADSSSETPTLVAHRGGFGGTSLEHTPDGLYKTYKAGIRYVELDVWFNKEGKEFILHDETVNRTTSCSGKAVDMTIAKLTSCGVMTLDTALYLVKKYGFTVYLHVKNVNTTKQAKELVREVAEDKLTGYKVRYLGDTATDLALIDKYADRRYLALLVSKTEEWSNKTYPELWYYSGPITQKQVDAAQARGQKVSIVENRSAIGSLLAGLTYGVDKWMTNDVDRDLGILDGLLKPARDAEAAAKAKAEADAKAKADAAAKAEADAAAKAEADAAAKAEADAAAKAEADAAAKAEADAAAKAEADAEVAQTP